MNNKLGKKKEEQFEKISVSENKSDSDYDCVVPVSGGKDSYYQTSCDPHKDTILSLSL